MSKDKKKKLQGFDKAVLKRVLTHIKKYRILVILSFVCAMITVASTLYAPILTGDAIDLIVGKGLVDFDGIKDIIYTFLMVTVVTVISQWFMNIINNHITYSVVRDIRIEVFNHMEELPLSYIDSHKHGDIVSRIVSDIDQFADGLLMGFTQLFTGIVTILATLGFMIAVNVPIALVVIVLTPLSLFVASFIAKRTYHLFHQQSETRGEITALVDEMVGQQKIVQAFGYEDDALDRFEEINNRLEKDSMSATFYSSLVNPCTRFVNNLVYAAVGIIGAISAIMTGLTVGQLTCFLSYANQYTKPFNEISNVITELQNAMACAGRVFELLDETPQVPEKENAHVLTDTKGAIEIKDVNFSYVKDKTLITNLNLSVKPGMRVAIVGPTGCGKSTLINLLMRFYDVDTGSISVDGTDIRDMTRDSLRQNYGMVLQETWLKSGTIRENIAYGKPDATDEEIVQAAKLAHSDSFIRRLPQGYDTVIAEDGGNLSQGQKQLLCITRVMLLLPPMLILDEATSSIDTRTEIRIQKAFNRMMQGRTSFIVAHRLSTIREADVILVMKDGNIIEKGNHDQLMAQNGFYTNLYNSQFAH
ncbi:ABC transporter ATP-binding protein [Clostridium sp. AF15-6B]|jgi:ATP-binding cassette subfamily B multidrug efflux pump|uniref:ABC transporter ATP-binding protein n=1 Tax=Coprococcus hominis (ex Arizal et al. 2022) TaxID=2881262 RepID=UPI000E49A72C|nr:ABC transporter ATP-binding protein [Clostridium sp. AF16-25]RGH05802.1 ABC transporter ATP-binding protein [Clostridium sp. AF15-49]RGH11838.1 ABC transporter ATP-binding protein [Clostridium sp. AF15-6B]